MVGGIGLYFCGATTLLQREDWYAPGARFFASGREATEKTGGADVNTRVIFFENHCVAPSCFCWFCRGVMGRGLQGDYGNVAGVWWGW